MFFGELQNEIIHQFGGCTSLLQCYQVGFQGFLHGGGMNGHHGHMWRWKFHQLELRFGDEAECAFGTSYQGAKVSAFQFRKMLSQEVKRIARIASFDARIRESCCNNPSVFSIAQQLTDPGVNLTFGIVELCFCLPLPAR